jgi:hypothetical protein
MDAVGSDIFDRLKLLFLLVLEGIMLGNTLGLTLRNELREVLARGGQGHRTRASQLLGDQNPLLLNRDLLWRGFLTSADRRGPAQAALRNRGRPRAGT